MPTCSSARVSALAVRTSIASRDVGSTPATSRLTSAARMPLRPGRPSAASRSARQTRFRAAPWRSHWISGSDRKTRASSQGIGTFWAAIFAFRSDESALALRLASRTGLSTEARLPSLSVQVQVPASPSTRPGRLLISTSQRPCLVRTSRSTS